MLIIITRIMTLISTLINLRQYKKRKSEKYVIILPIKAKHTKIRVQSTK